MQRTRFTAIVVTLLLTVLLAACSKPETSKPADQTPSGTVSTPPPSSPATETVSPGEVDVAVRKVLQAYFEALNQGDYTKAAGYWSPTARLIPESLKIPGVSNWFFLSSEMIDNTATEARVQLNFTVDVAQGAQSPYINGRNVRFVKLTREGVGWQIQSMTASP